MEFANIQQQCRNRAGLAAGARSRGPVTVAAGMLRKPGLIEHERGCVRRENRKGLEKAACECYSIIRDK